MKPQDPKSPSALVVVRRRQVLALPLLLAGCAEPYVVGAGSGTRPPPGPQPGPQRVATLDVEGDVEVAQSGRRFRGQDGNALFRGDEVRTFATSYALLTFMDGNRVWLDYNTRVRVGSLFTYFGRVFASVSGYFQVDSDFVAASSEGTEYTVTVGRGTSEAFSVAVRSGVVRCQPPRGGRWSELRLSGGQRLRAHRTTTPTIDRIDERTAHEEFGWVGARRVPDRVIPRDRVIPQDRVTPTTPPDRVTPTTPPDRVRPTTPPDRGTPPVRAIPPERVIVPEQVPPSQAPRRTVPQTPQEPVIW